MRYDFVKVESCNMCGDDVKKHKILGQRLNGQVGFRPRNKQGITVTIARCNSCGLIYSNPMPIPFNLQDHYGIPPESYWIPEYFEIDENNFSYEINVVKDLLGFKEGMTALDIGAGIGKSFISLTKAGFDTYGFEPSVPFYERAINKMGIPGERLKLGSIEEIEYEKNSFDFITFGAVLEHLYDPGASIHKAMEWLKPDGIIHIEVPSSKWFMSSLINAYYKIAGTRFVTNLSPMHEPFHLYEFDVKSFLMYSKKYNYEVLKYDHFVCEIPSVPKVFHPFLKKYMQLTKTGLQLVLWLRKKP
jgi:2-polyprenyl-3-methyl-5-hydroxy-6-metoxy-1,4-benzoquinol methylase